MVKNNHDSVSAIGARHIGGLEACSPGKILKSRVPEMPFPVFWEMILQNSEEYCL